MRILITGVSGFIGRNLANYWCRQPAYTIAGIGRGTAVPEGLPETLLYLPVDITNAVSVLRVMESFKPDWVIHSAAMSKPNDCEQQQEQCHKVNVQATQWMMEACKKVNVRLLLMSTDFVFGDWGPFKEDDAYGPVNYYGHSKMEAELLVKNSGLHWVVVRTVLVYGRPEPGLSPSFPHWVKSQLLQGTAIRVFTDQFRTATYVVDLVKGIDAILQQNASGIFHLCGAETLTPFDIAKTVARHGGFEEALVQPVTRAEFAEAARRPIRSTLDISKAKRELGYSPHALGDVLANIF